ncbi:type II toxin-antitoxin system RelE/ParE family toxin [Prosthecobacter sp.]|uniref:type II toxin-antitoxin system RelE/ParE family toxin n=1 Tax=Prosthecobacter sp. TaxID=1965333 RepID=UPI003785036A
MNVILEDDAKQDPRDSFHFYEQDEPGAGWYFLDKMQAELQALGGFGGVHRLRFGFHFYASKRFPHGVYYRVEGHTVQIAAIIDSRRNPKLIRKTLRKR